MRNKMVKDIVKRSPWVRRGTRTGKEKKGKEKKGEDEGGFGG